MRRIKRLLLLAIIIMPLTFSIAGCGVSRGIVLNDREQIFPHPTDSGQVCLDKGYIAEIFEELDICGR